MKRIMVIATGGTIAMKKDEKAGGLVPAAGGEELAASVPGITSYAEIQVREFSNIPSEFMTVEKMHELCRFIDANAGEADGFVVTHGTDTMEETAFFLDYALRTEKPVVLTGAMRGASEISADGPANLLGAVRVAADDDAAGRGVLAVMNDTIHAARDMEKTDAVSLDAFQSPQWGAAGRIGMSRIHWGYRPVPHDRLHPEELARKVWLVKCAAGIGGDIVTAAEAAGAEGLVVEGFGCGNVPLAVDQAIRTVIGVGMPVVLVSRTQHGSVEKAYGYEGGAASLEAAGCLLGGSLSGQKARILLMIGLGAGLSREELRRLFSE